MKLPRPLRERGVAVLALAFVLAFALSQFMGDSPVPAVDTDQGLAPGQVGLRAVIDPETGALATGTEAQRLLADKLMDEDLRNMLSRSSAGLVPVTHPDGRVSVDLQGRFMNASVARIGQDGRVVQACMENAEDALQFLNSEESAVENDASGPEVR